MTLSILEKIIFFFFLLFHSFLSTFYCSLAGLGMENIGGIFVVLICGLIVAIFMAMLEFLWTLRHSEATEVSFQWGVTCSVGQEIKRTGSGMSKSHYRWNV